MQIAHGQIHRRFNGFHRIDDLVVFFVQPFNSAQNRDCFGNVGFLNVNFLKTAQKSAVFSIWLRNSLYVVDPIQRKVPEASAGFNKLDASIVPPEVAPAPITVWISSMNSKAPGSSSKAVKIFFSRSSKSPR